tara:strand:+ start:749 stop:1615 length:867 start_codon:yes stop_codon:yes gene_type:complete
LKENPLVSVLINCFNEQKYIKKSIQSIIDQTYKNWELIIWDDKSSDNTLKIVKSFQDKRIKIFTNDKHLGLGPSRIKAQEKISGEFVAILDADDFSEKDRLERQIKIFKMNKNVSIVCSWVKLIDENDRVIGKNTFTDNYFNLKETLSYKNIIPHPSVMYKTDSAKRSGWYNDSLEYAQDYDLSIKLLHKEEGHVIKDFLTSVRIRKNSMTLSKNLRELRIKEVIIILKKIRRMYNLKRKISHLNLRNIKIYELKLDILSLNFSNFIKKTITILSKLFSLFIIYFKNE